MKALIIGKWQVVHYGHKDLFNQVISIGGLEKLLVGIGVKNRFGKESNIFSPEEVKEMLEPVVKQAMIPYKICFVPDVKDYEQNVKKIFGYENPKGVMVVSGNEFLIKNFENKGYKIFRPKANIDVSGTKVRNEILKDGDWQKYVPQTTTNFLLKGDNILRIKKAIDEWFFPPYVNWELTNKCNMGCPYCFLGEHPEGVLPDLPTDKAKSLIERLVEGEAKMLNYSGGEPLLRKDIIELIKYGKSLGLKTVLSTNGILLSKSLIDELEHCLDWVSLPIDGYNSETHDSIRGRKGHFDEVLKHLGELEKTDVNIKINSMLCKKNIDLVEKIAELLDDYDIKKWKLFQFSARGKAKKVREEYEISNEEFLASKEKLGNHRFDIIYSSNELRDNAYFLIGVDGKVHIPAGNEYIYLGNLLSDEPTKFKNQEILKIGKNNTNAKISYDLES